VRDRSGAGDDVEPSVYETEVEFDRLRTAVSWGQVEEHARKLHSGQGHHNVPKLRHCYGVAELAARHARHVFRDCDFFAQRYRELACRAGGLLHEAMDCGASFEDVVRAADEAVAQLVASITADRRLPRPKRARVYTNQVGLASAAAQAIKLADLQHDCLLLKGARPGPETEAWAEEAREVLASLGRIHTVAALAEQVWHLKADLQAMARKRRDR